MSNKTKVAQIPSLPADTPAALRQYLEALKQAVELGEGLRGDPLDAKLTRRDLVDLGLADEKSHRAPVPGVSASGLLEPREAPPNLTTPPPVAMLQANGAFSRVILAWGASGYVNHAHVEIYRAQVRDVGRASLVGTQAGRVHIDNVGGGFTGYYWARNVSTSGVRGPFSTAAAAQTTPDYEAVRGLITATQWQASTAYRVYDSIKPTTEVAIGSVPIRLVALTAGTSGDTEPNWSSITELGGTLADGSVTWQALEAGRVPFFIDPASGTVVIDGAAIREASIDSLQVRDGFLDNLTAAKGTLGEANISVADIFNIIVGNQIKSENFSAGSAGWRISKSGNVELNNGTFRGQIDIKSSDTGARLEQTNSVIRVYDENGVLRVKLGDLS